MRLETLPWRSEKGEIVAQLCYVLICKTETVLTVTMHISAKIAFIR